MNKKERIEIFENTVEICNKGFYQLNENHQNIYVNHLDEKMIQETKFYGKKVNLNHNNLPTYETEIKVVNEDCLYTAQKLIDNNNNENVAVLNMASFHTPGGGVTKGAAAQEENIFRRTNIFKSLFQFHYVGDQYNIKQKDERYPLNYNYGAIYTPYVTVFRKSDDENYQLMENTYTINVISIPALKNPKLENGKIVTWAKCVIKNKIKQMLDIALENNNKIIVLSAFGCGAYNTPPTQMAKLFADIIASETYQGKFKKIYFAILDTNTTTNQQGNFKPFKEIFIGNNET